MAETHIEAIEAKAIVQIELSCLDAQTQIATSGLTSEVAKRFIESLPAISTLMPALSFAEIAGEADPPIAEQLVSRTRCANGVTGSVTRRYVTPA
jgi:hypothetical protein